MIVKRFYEDALAQASYLIGCVATGEAAVIDANRSVEQYIEAAAAEKLRIVAVTETHIHADYVSGSRELAERTGATLYLSDEGDDTWKYAFAGQPNVRLVRHGDVIRVGRLRLDVARTPGHTPEHITFILTDEAASGEPLGAFTGDFIFAGDVGRPDLLERAAGVKGTMEAGARTLYRSVAGFKALPDHLLLWPGHGAGSACGRSLGGLPVTSLGYEKLANWGLRTDDEQRFVGEVLSGQPDPPAYFREMKRINKEGPPLLAGFKQPPRLAGSQLADLLERREMVIDIRSAAETAMGLLPGALNLPLGAAFTTWAGWLLPYGRPLYLLASGDEDVAAAVRYLALIGLDDVRGWFGAEVLRSPENRERLETVPQIAAVDAARQLADRRVVVLDVRSGGEYEAGHIPGALHISLGDVTRRAAEVPRGRPVVVHCAGGTRSPIAVSLLRRLGIRDVINMPGGFTEYAAAGLEVEQSGMAEPVAEGSLG
jgi:hydroxyacylglutathione hydrolase